MRAGAVIRSDTVSLINEVGEPIIEVFMNKWISDVILLCQDHVIACHKSMKIICRNLNNVLHRYNFRLFQVEKIWFHFQFFISGGRARDSHPAKERRDRPQLDMEDWGSVHVLVKRRTSHGQKPDQIADRQPQFGEHPIICYPNTTWPKTWSNLW